MIQFSLGALREKIESFWPKKFSQLNWVETKTFKLVIYCMVTQRVTGSLYSLLNKYSLNRQERPKENVYKDLSSLFINF